MLPFNIKKVKESNMTKMKFFGSLAFVAAIFVLSVFFTGNSPALFIDIASLILGIFVPWIVVSFIYAPSEQRALTGAILEVRGHRDEQQLKRALAYLKSFRKLMIYSGIIWTITGAIGISAHLEGPEVLGMNFGVLMIIPLYISLFLVMVIEPLRGTAEKKLIG
jgi:flagellar motor component MotA